MSGKIFGPFLNIEIAGAGLAFPSNKLSTEEALNSVPIGRSMAKERRVFVAETLNQKLGIQSRYWSYLPGDPIAKDHNTAQLASRALENALSYANVSPHQIELLCVSTSTPHRYTGTVACAVGKALGIKAPCVDIRSGCSSGFFALGQAAFQLQAGANHVALVGSDTFSSVVPPTNRLALTIMGDGAAALVLGQGDCILHAVYFDSDGSLSGMVETPGALPPSIQSIEQGLYLLSGDINGFDQQIPSLYRQAIDAVLNHASISSAQIDWFVPHQTSIPTAMDVARHYDIPAEKVWAKGIAEHANIGAGNWMAALGKALCEGDIQKGQTVLSAGVGGGMSWGAALWTF